MNNVKILGQDYEIIISNEEEDHRLVDKYAICERYSKEIIFNTLEIRDIDKAKNLNDLQTIIVNHEIIHSFFHESGLSMYCEDEILVQYLAVQLEKICKASAKANTIYKKLVDNTSDSLDKEIIYLAGPITGVKNYKEIFMNYQDAYEKEGYIVLNPAILPHGLKDYLDICYKMIDQATVVYFLPGWENSIGATFEYKYCLQTNKKFETL